MNLMTQTEHLSGSICFPTPEHEMQLSLRQEDLTPSHIPSLPARLSSSSPPLSSPVFPVNPNGEFIVKCPFLPLLLGYLGERPPQSSFPSCSCFILSPCIFTSGTFFFFPSLSKYLSIHLLIGLNNNVYYNPLGTRLYARCRELL